MKIVQAIVGFVAGDPHLTVRPDGTPRLYIRIGINHWQPRDDGTFAQLPSTFHDLVQYGKGAALSHQRFRRGDNIVAQGHVREYTRTVDGTERQDEVFIARRVVHDPNTTTYDVHRKPRSPDRQPPEQASAQPRPPVHAEAHEHAAASAPPASPTSPPPPPSEPPSPTR